MGRRKRVKVKFRLQREKAEVKNSQYLKRIPLLGRREWELPSVLRLESFEDNFGKRGGHVEIGKIFGVGVFSFWEGRTNQSRPRTYFR